MFFFSQGSISLWKCNDSWFCISAKWHLHIVEYFYQIFNWIRPCIRSDHFQSIQRCSDICMCKCVDIFPLPILIQSMTFWCDYQFEHPYLIYNANLNFFISRLLFHAYSLVTIYSFFTLRFLQLFNFNVSFLIKNVGLVCVFLIIFREDIHSTNYRNHERRFLRKGTSVLITKR